MTTIPPIVAEAEAFVRDLSEQLLEPWPGECLCCYLARELMTVGCDGTHRHTLRFRDTTAPRATGLVPRLAELGACCCDCEVLINAYELAVPPRGDEDGYLELPPCRLVRGGSTQPCANWMRMRRW